MSELDHRQDHHIGPTDDENALLDGIRQTSLDTVHSAMEADRKARKRRHRVIGATVVGLVTAVIATGAVLLSGGGKGEARSSQDSQAPTGGTVAAGPETPGPSASEATPTSEAKAKNEVDAGPSSADVAALAEKLGLKLTPIDYPGLSATEATEQGLPTYSLFEDGNSFPFKGVDHNLTSQEVKDPVLAGAIINSVIAMANTGEVVTTRQVDTSTEDIDLGRAVTDGSGNKHLVAGIADTPETPGTFNPKTLDVSTGTDAAGNKTLTISGKTPVRDIRDNSQWVIDWTLGFLKDPDNNPAPNNIYRNRLVTGYTGILVPKN